MANVPPESGAYTPNGDTKYYLIPDDQLERILAHPEVHNHIVMALGLEVRQWRDIHGILGVTYLKQDGTGDTHVGP